MALVGDSIHPIDLAQIFAGAGNIMQLRQARAAEERQNAFRQAMQNGDMVGAQAADPGLFAKLQQQQLEEQKAGMEMAKSQGQLVDDRAARTQKLQQQYLARAQANPHELPNLMRLRDSAVNSGNFSHFALPGEDTADTQLAPGMTGPEALPGRAEVRSAQVAAGADPYAGMSGDVKDYLQRYPNDSPDVPGFGGRVDAWDRQNRKSSATNVNVGGKILPANEVGDLSDLDTAMQSVDDLLTAFKRDVGSSDVAAQIQARGEKYVPNTAVAQYQNDANVTAQTVGLILENGKLGEADLPRYKSMNPQPGDSIETAERKVAIIKELLRKKRMNRSQALGSAGYRPPAAASGAAPGNASPPPLSTQQKITARVLDFERNGIPRAKQLEILQQEKLLTPEQAAAMQPHVGGQ